MTSPVKKETVEEFNALNVVNATSEGQQACDAACCVLNGCNDYVVCDLVCSIVLLNLTHFSLQLITYSVLQLITYSVLFGTYPSSIVLVEYAIMCGGFCSLLIFGLQCE